MTASGQREDKILGGGGAVEDFGCLWEDFV